MSDEDDDWLRRFTEQDIDEDEGYRPRRTIPIDRALASAEEPAVITVVVDERGAVSDVLIAAQWRDVVRPRDLGRVLLEATNKAIVNQVASQVELLDPEELVERPEFAHRVAPSAGGDPTSPVAESLVNEVLELFSRFDAELAAYTAHVRQAASGTTRSEGFNGRIVVTVAAGQVSGVDVDVKWASVARHTEIRAEAMSAFHAARQQAASCDVRGIPLPPAIARLQELASDPEALSRQLGLSR
ncbi:MAG TPA: hypothetical protein VGP04_11475 [Pseudonocardiaceae bacterium]|jgi:hypothetical protein|nr:hypothetical protein [Pseudonocardiaceae bacterium]